MNTIFKENQGFFMDFFNSANEKGINVIVIVSDEKKRSETIFSDLDPDNIHERMLIDHNAAFMQNYPAIKEEIAKEYVKETLSNVGEMAIPALNNFAGMAKDFISAFSPKNQTPEPDPVPES